jgi:glycosyltransferase involved in cell wall biosynthesis
MPKIVVVIPAHNEERFIGSVVLKTRQYVDTVIVVDDGSADGTRQLAAAAGAQVCVHETNMGKGVALNTAFRAAREHAPDAVVTLDGDWQHLPEQLEQVAAPVLAGDADIVIGSRYLQHDSQVPTARVIGHLGFNLMTSVLSGISVSDSQSGYRAFSPRALRELDFSSRSFSVESEQQFLARRHTLKVVEVPIIIRYNDKPKRPLVKHGLNVLEGVLHLVVKHRPLFFFAIPGTLCLLLGVVFGALVVHSYNVSQTLAVGTGLLTVLFLLLGTFFMFVGIILWALRVLVEDLRR